MKKTLINFAHLLEIMDILREKCPWDKKQTMLTLRNNTIEECFELSDALIDENMEHIKEELGDLLLHIVFYSKIASEEGAFDIEDVAKALTDKLIYRHPHVFGDIKADSASEVAKNWEELKTKKSKGGVLDGVPRGMPALPKALRIGQKAASAGFDWQQKEDVWDKVKEEIAEVEFELRSGNKDRMEDEIGDLYFALTNAARLYNIDPEAALERTNKKFIHRFEYIEQKAKEKGLPLQEMTLDEMERYWNEAKEGVN